MFDALCTFPLRYDIFAQSTHPTKPLFVTGLASGHVQLHRLPVKTDPAATSGGAQPASQDPGEPATAYIDTVWRTRRHKPSCRTLAFTPTGDHILSAGTDGLVKRARTEDGRVVQKFLVPGADQGSAAISVPTCITTLSRQELDGPFNGTGQDQGDLILVSTDGEKSCLYAFDERDCSGRPAQEHTGIHADYITSITPLPLRPKQGQTQVGPATQVLTTGGTTVAVIDLRMTLSKTAASKRDMAGGKKAPQRRTRGVVVQSEEQDEELLSCVIIGRADVQKSIGGRGSDALAIVGGANGTLRVWDVGLWDDSEIEVRVAPAGCNILAPARPWQAMRELDKIPSVQSSGEKSLDSDSDGDSDSSFSAYRPTDSSATNFDSLLAIGCEDGTIRFVDFEHMLATTRVEPDGTRKGGRPKVLKGKEIVHHDIEEVNCLGWLADGRLVSGGGPTVQIWEERPAMFAASPLGVDAIETSTLTPGQAQNGVELEDIGDADAEKDDDPEQDDDSEEEDSSDSDDGSRSKSSLRRQKKRKRGKEFSAGALKAKQLNKGRSFNFDGLT